MRIAALVKQIPQFETMTLGADGRLIRSGLPLEMNAYCRRAVAKAVELALERRGSSVAVFTLGPPPASDVLREAIAWGDAHGLAAIDGVLVSDPAFAGSDTLATSRAIAGALRVEGPFDLVLCGRNSVDADTGQVGPQIAELLDLPFVTAVRHVSIDGDGTGATVRARAELDDGWMQLETTLPAVLSCAERLCEPCKVEPAGRAAISPDRIRLLRARDLGPGPWGVPGSPTRVGDVRALTVERARLRWPDLELADQIERAIMVMDDRGALVTDPFTGATGAAVPEPRPLAGPAVVALIEPDREAFAAELLGAAARLAEKVGGHVAAIGPATAVEGDLAVLGGRGADVAIAVEVATTEADLATAIGEWAARREPAIVLAPSTTWGREIAARIAARLGAGLTGDAVDVEIEGGRLVAWKPAFGGALVAAITCTSTVQMATVRAGMLVTPAPRASVARIEHLETTPRRRVRVLARARDDDLDVLAEATTVIGVGRGVAPERYPDLEPLRTALRAELAATRKVTDEGWMPRARQVGITGRSIAPRLFVSLGAGGTFNHAVGYRGAGTVLAINRDPQASVFDTADVGIVGDWDDVVPLFVEQLALRSAQRSGR